MPTDSAALESGVSAMASPDVARGLELSRAAGWNQTEADWGMMLRLGAGYGARDAEGRLVASSIVLPYPPAIGWISMVLVDESARRRGLATRLLENAIAVLRKQGLVPMVDATPAGREVYRRMGFVDVAPISRWRGRGAGVSAQSRETSSAVELAAGIAQDEAAFGISRRPLLLELAGRRGAITLSLSDRRGQLWSRAGRTATQIGPVVAAGEGDGLALCAMALDAMAGPVLLDVPDRNAPLADLLASRGFSIERPFIRMALGVPSASTLGAAMRVIAGPELG
ncbi:GNAT family N-acetyltransferase [Dongia sedimenti]|uniref:GNAT family N-acetyltransferase n=1 Tax=Dongia sedimenti TaxID=3064282 RepID=A0ABU0YEP5_9PROT|nr:GNAT family N-acetyltransferase [Rhodospirillaceae bacterium R-7]